MKSDNTNQDNIDTDMRGKQMASMLNEHANRLSMRTLKQLENGRATALRAHAKHAAHATNSGGTLTHIFSWAGHHRMVSTGLILATLITGLALVQSFGHQESSDAFLLGADLPPEAFVDRGFEPTLNNGQHKNI